ncbi:hypothetical protein ACSBR2_033062 [Camellia fascicularis]
MAKLRMNGNKKKNGIVKLKIVVEKLQKSLLMVKKPACDVPEDVKEGHFAVIAVDVDELKRFIVPLNYLTNPSFMRLLELAAEEYGFDREGALTVPCPPRDLERILAEQWAKEERENRVGGDNWGGSSKTLVKSC